GWKTPGRTSYPARAPDLSANRWYGNKFASTTPLVSSQPFKHLKTKHHRPSAPPTSSSAFRRPPPPTFSFDGLYMSTRRNTAPEDVLQPTNPEAIIQAANAEKKRQAQLASNNLTSYHQDNTRSDDSSPSESTSKPAIQVTPPTTQTPAITPSPQPPIPTTVDNTTPSSSKATGPSNALSPLPPPASSSLKSTHSRSSSKHSHRSGT
ncbi:hypothetical protein PTTG_09002, partial [Puccinia triticina 1-1 BBBD Race 1]